MTSSVATGSGTDGRVACEFPGCRREFRELKHLKVHRMQHTDERPLSCALCSYSCRQRNSLNWHMTSRHGLSKTVTDDGRTVYVSSTSWRDFASWPLQWCSGKFGTTGTLSSASFSSPLCPFFPLPPLLFFPSLRSRPLKSR